MKPYILRTIGHRVQVLRRSDGVLLGYLIKGWEEGGVSTWDVEGGYFYSTRRDAAEALWKAKGQPPADLPPDHPGGLRVMSKMCATCVFTDRSPVRAGRRHDLERSWVARDTHQVCHHSAVWDESDGEVEDEADEVPPLERQVVCHGFFREVFLRHGTGQMLRIAERLGGFEYVNPDDYPLGGQR